ncbi:MoxR family ATPase [Paludicola sp. MB14-C6]|uniref:AAA family ATPase n=1 Tax=Paludihabitans sp. MB14-C6 TaxID=3070656 RepID=UPI0027DB2274|nr:MoxR family ATPase [Paludicola sp. MB14-C6]WMJ24085.1 MoxR family ATPase [Paludicola sp. MB14-C6]
MSNFVQDIAVKITDNISQVIIGKEELIEKMLVSLFSNGHILLEDNPGTGKTTLAKSLAKSMDCAFKRVQFTPDLLPSDITGINYYNQKLGEFVLKRGSLFTNLLLADEINRATPRTQSALLECMEEHQVTIDGVTYPIEEPFIVIATQNPIETQGTFPLPEAQLDRFFMKLSMGYPSDKEEIAILNNFILHNPLSTLENVVTKQDILTAQEQVKAITVSDAVKDYIVRIVNATRTHEDITLGVSPRASLALMRASQSLAAINGREFVLPDDVKAICKEVLCHRIIVKNSHLLKQEILAPTIIQTILDTVEVPII